MRSRKLVCVGQALVTDLFDARKTMPPVLVRDHILLYCQQMVRLLGQCHLASVRKERNESVGLQLTSRP